MPQRAIKTCNSTVHYSRQGLLRSMSGTCRRCPPGESTVCQLLSLILLLALHEPKATSVYACTCGGVSSWVTEFSQFSETALIPEATM